MEYYVYCYLDPRKPGKYIFGDYTFDYEPIYVGKGTGARMYAHYKPADLNRCQNKQKVNKIRRILASGFKPIILTLHRNLNESEALQYENKLVQTIGRADLGLGTLTNLTNGGELAPNFTHLTADKKEICREKHRRYLTERNPMKNPKTAAKVAAFNKQRVRSKEECERVSKGLRNSQLHIDACKSPIRNGKIKESKRKFMVAVDQYDKQMNFIATYESISEAARQLNTTKVEIMDVLSGRQKTHKGYIFKKHLK
jgi:hypothetical protein